MKVIYMENIFLKILSLGFSAGIIVLVVLLAKLAFKRAPRWIHCLLWGVVALRLVIPWNISLPVGIHPSDDVLSLQTVEINSNESNIAYTASVPVFSTGIEAVDSAVNDSLQKSMTPEIGDSADPVQIWSFVGFVIWIIGIAGMTIYAFISYFLIKRKCSEAVPLIKISEKYAQIISETGCSGCRIFTSENVSTPFILGIFRPCIYVPTSLDFAALKTVLSHERAHILRRDHLWKPIGFILLSVYWINPLLWAAYILLCRDIEMACDEKVVENMSEVSRKEYSETLLSLSMPRRMISACPVAFGEVGVKDRIKNVLNYRKPAFRIIIAAALTGLVIGIFLITGRESSKENDLYSVYFSDKNVTDDYKDYRNVGNFLSALPSECEELEKAGILVTSSWADNENKKKVWNDFAGKLSRKEKAVLTTASYTDEGDPIFIYVYFDGAKYYYAFDNSRDKFGTPQAVSLTGYDYMYSYTPSEDSFVVLLTNIENLTYLQFRNMCLFYDDYQEDLMNNIKTIADLWDVDGLTGIGGEYGYASPKISEHSMINGTYLNSEYIYVSPVNAEEVYPGGAVYVFTDETCNVYPRYDFEAEPLMSVTPQTGAWEEFYSEAEWESFFESSGGDNSTYFKNCSDVMMMRYTGGIVIILADGRLYAAKLSDRQKSLCRLEPVEDRWPAAQRSYVNSSAGQNVGLAAAGSQISVRMVPSSTGLEGIYADYFFIPIEGNSYRYRIERTTIGSVDRDKLIYSCKEADEVGRDAEWVFYSLTNYPGMEKILGIRNGSESIILSYFAPLGVSEQDITFVKESGFAVMENGSIVSGSKYWEEFLALSEAGSPATVCIANVYRSEYYNMSNNLSVATLEDYPSMFLSKLSYDGSQYTVEPMHLTDGEFLLYGIEGVDSPKASFKYLKHYSGTPGSSAALYTSYDKYVLVNDNSVTWEDIEKGLFSSQFGDYIEHRVVFNQYDYFE